MILCNADALLLHFVRIQACIEGYYYYPNPKQNLKCTGSCCQCHSSSVCYQHTTLESLIVKEGWYRFERTDPTLYSCPREKLCLESSNDPSDDASNCR